MGKENVVYVYNRVSFSLKKERNHAIGKNMDKPRGYYVK
jgi:hypothetical protein